MTNDMNCLLCSRPVDLELDYNAGFGYLPHDLVDPHTSNWMPRPGAIDRAFHRDCAEVHGEAAGLHEA